MKFRDEVIGCFFVLQIPAAENGNTFRSHMYNYSIVAT